MRANRTRISIGEPPLVPLGVGLRALLGIEYRCRQFMNTAAARENWEGQVVDGKFPLVKWLGGSERSAVFSTQLPGKEKDSAAIKLISPDAGDPEALFRDGATAERQLSRWQLAATLSHPNLLRVLHSGQCQISNTPVLYVVMEFAEEDLSQVLPTRALSPEEAREMLPPLLDAISYLHDHGLVHGSVRPSNIQSVGEQLKLSSDHICAIGEFGNKERGASAFDAPGVARGGASRASDIWSLGVTLVRCLSPGLQARESYHPIEQGIAQTIPDPFRHIARECLRKDPATRCTLADIRTWLKPAAPSAVAVEQDDQRWRPSLSVMAAVAVIILLAVAFVVRWATHGKSEAPAQTSPQQVEIENAAPPPSIRDAAPAAAPASPPVAAPAANSPAGATQTQGAVVKQVAPDVPSRARNTIQGKIRVSVRVAVNPAGDVTGAEFSTPGPSKYFARLAMEASRRWKFKPAESDGQPVSSEWVLRYQFTQSAINVVPEELPAGTQ
jgi:TonB family protein